MKSFYLKVAASFKIHMIEFIRNMKEAIFYNFKSITKCKEKEKA